MDEIGRLTVGDIRRAVETLKSNRAKRRSIQTQAEADEANEALARHGATFRFKVGDPYYRLFKRDLINNHEGINDSSQAEAEAEIGRSGQEGADEAKA